MRAHHHLLVAAREIGQRLLLVADGDGQVAEHGLHVVDAGDAPAVLRPVGEVGIVVRGARPDEAAVFRLGRVGRLVLLVALEHHLRDAQVRLVHELVHARRRLELIFALQRQCRAADLRVVGAVDVPLFDHAARGVVVHLGVFPEGIPVPLDAELLLEKFDALFEVLDRVGLHLRLVDTLRRRDLERGQVLEVPREDVRLRDRAVARHRAGEVALADARIVVHHGDAALGGGLGADVRRQAEVLHGVDVEHTGVLVDLRRQTDGEHGDVDPLHGGEAHHDQVRGHLVEHDGVLAQLCRALAVGAQVLVAHDDVAHAEDGVVQHGEKLVVRIAQLLAAQTHGVAVDHVRRGEVGHHPAVAQHGLDHQDRVAAELCGHEAVEIEPAEEIIKGVPEAAPFAGAEGAVLGGIKAAEALAGFGVIGHVSCPPFALHAAASFPGSPRRPARACAADRSAPRCRGGRWRECGCRNHAA